MNKKKWRLLFIISCILLSSCFGRDFPVRLRSSFSTPLHDGMEMNLELSGLGAQEPKNLLNFPSSQNLKRQTTQVLKNTAAALAQELKFAPVELILQNPELPNGCEVTSLAMLLTSAGFPVDHVKLYQQYLPNTNNICPLRNSLIPRISGWVHLLMNFMLGMLPAAQVAGTALKAPSLKLGMPGYKQTAGEAGCCR